MSRRYILVADASRARLFREQPDHAYEVVEGFDHADSRARARDLMADANGRKPVGGSVGNNYGGRAVSLGVGRVGVAPDTEPKQVEAEKFARELAASLDAHLHNEDAKLILVAPPHFLGLVKEALGKETSRKVERTLDKDLTHAPPAEVHEHVRSALLPQ